MQKLYDHGMFKSFRILANKSNFANKIYIITLTTATCRRGYRPTAFYTFANHLALISFAHTTPPYVSW